MLMFEQIGINRTNTNVDKSGRTPTTTGEGGSIGALRPALGVTWVALFISLDVGYLVRIETGVAFTHRF